MMLLLCFGGYKAEKKPGMALGLETGYRIGYGWGSVFCNITTRTMHSACLLILDSYSRCSVSETRPHALSPKPDYMQHHRRCPRLAGGLDADQMKKTVQMRTDMARRTTFLRDVAFCTSFRMGYFRWWGLIGTISGRRVGGGSTL